MGNGGQQRRPGGTSVQSAYGHGNQAAPAPGKRTRSEGRYSGSGNQAASPAPAKPNSAAPVVTPVNDFVRETVVASLSVEDPGLRARAVQFVRSGTHWPTFKAQVLNAHEWNEDTMQRLVFVRYFSEEQRRFWDGEPDRGDVINDVVGVEVAHFLKFSGVGDHADSAIGEMSENESPYSSLLEAAKALESPQATGSGIVVFYDSMQRLAYAKRVKLNAEIAVLEIGEALRLEEYERVEQIARRANSTRNAERVRTQGRVSPGAQRMSEALEKPRAWDDVFPDRLEKNKGDRMKTFRDVAKSSGKTNASVLVLGRVGAIAGPAMVIASTYDSSQRIASTPEDKRGRVASEETGGAVGGALGSMLGTGAAATALTVVLGSNPAGWLVIGVSLIGGGFGGFAGSALGRESGGKAHDAVSNAAEHVYEASEHFMWRIIRGRW